jgi:hypothetical protein
MGKADLRAGIGKHLIVELVSQSDSERLEFDIVPDEFADLRNGFLGAGTPLAKAVTGLSKGGSRPYHMGDVLLVRVLDVTPAGPPPKENLEKRQDTIRKAIDQSDRTNAMIFASSFSGKWGDYDPTGFEAGDSQEKGSPTQETESDESQSGEPE